MIFTEVYFGSFLQTDVFASCLVDVSPATGVDGRDQGNGVPFYRAECRRADAPVIALGGVEDHIHLLIQLPATIAVAEIVKRVKGCSSHLVTHGKPLEPFQWQAGYGAFTITKSLVPRVKSYIDNQETHHKEETTILALEQETQ